MATTTYDIVLTLQQNIKSIIELVGEDGRLANIALKPFKKVMLNLHKEKEKIDAKEKMDTDCVIIEPPKKKFKSKLERKGNGEENTVVATALLGWIMPFIRIEEQEKKFVDSYLRNGVQGYNAFRNMIQKKARPVYAQLHDTLETVEKTRDRFERKNGWLDNFAVNMQYMLWESLENKMPDWNEIMCAKGFEPYRKKLLLEWTQSLKRCKTTRGLAYSYESGVENVLAKWSGKQRTRPSRALFCLKQLAFLDPNQVKAVRTSRPLGKGVDGEVSLCTLEDVKYIPPECTLAQKRVLDKRKIAEAKRNGVINEAIVGGLQHPGIVGALAMTTNDPPTLVFDYFNGGTLDKMFEKIRDTNWPTVKYPMMETMELNRMKAFMENRIGICFAILETMESLHENGRLNCDLHLPNVLLHYLYDNEGSKDALVLRVMVGVCDWGRAMYMSDAPNYIPTPTKGKKKLCMIEKKFHT